MYRSDVTQPAQLAASPYIIGPVWELNKCVCIAPVSEVAPFHSVSVRYIFARLAQLLILIFVSEIANHFKVLSNCMYDGWQWFVSGLRQKVGVTFPGNTQHSPAIIRRNGFRHNFTKTFSKNTVLCS